MVLGTKKATLWPEGLDSKAARAVMSAGTQQTVSNFIPYLIMLISMKEEMECSHIGQIVWHPNGRLLVVLA
mgnify:CR=1 FL=1